ncbi:MAG TPA: NAD-dependent epimerase/dehydratase family protein [Anaeromyxobacteraceae bacterium]|jgi:nucleoside-diphosphate-sugar epimerase|nr:NAD-dependent epimerase/dehydratase family protein [Anaeromyxobacteraceae bacterium]
MRALVIGGTRFVGYLLARRLLAGGHQVTVLNRGTLADPFGPEVEKLRADRTGPGFAEALRGRSFDAVFDFAGYHGDDGRRAAALLDGRVGHYLAVSTGQVYLVRVDAPRPARERDYAGPVMPRPAGLADLREWEYGVGKRAYEDALAEAHAARGFPATVVRVPMVNGERDYYRRLERYLWRLGTGGPVILPDGGGHRLRHVYGGEVARFLSILAGKHDTFGEAYNLAQEETPTLLQLVSRLRDLLGSASPLVPVPSDRLLASGLDPLALSPFSGAWMSFLDPTRARVELGFRHELLDVCLGRIAASWLAHPPEDAPPGHERRAVELELARGAVQSL